MKKDDLNNEVDKDFISDKPLLNKKIEKFKADKIKSISLKDIKHIFKLKYNLDPTTQQLMQIVESYKKKGYKITS